MEEKKLTHLNQNNHPTMVDVGSKEITQRTAIAQGSIYMSKEAYQMTVEQKTKKGPVIQTAIIAGIMGAKKTSDLIPMCHPISINSVNLEAKYNQEECAITLIATLKCDGKTGIEMEALTSVSIGLLTIYDMLKAVDKGMKISDISLRYKSGGKSGEYQA
ncbi:cyclic pyranopterin monophosphate synthase MoaC [Helicobacter kayseriensis]|uniref:cyclic pyranopterin monophosphate synthase MoaC n=1 Tax=Helicobacter kayseriensis TaxID=2905877 RepID=UPI001E503AB7|nr:cyclic pyranopterin monophosphate synthase MoaC [Helicobacter kayseriensis]MCE3046794.1 cyclic pyranopterin monophosphate synthase MoaC [Helicobacter kayseriensis]MCE3047904.1 cyclic pyranopterin monophosphate synthase MoaC [Helicobacter kayseriensis]